MLVGVAVAAVGVWYMIHARPVAGSVIDEVDLGGGASLVVRAEAKSDRAFVELREGDTVRWQALVPPYGGRRGATGLAWSPTSVTVRVVRNQRAEIFALAMRDGSKLGGFTLAPNHGPITAQPAGPVSITDHAHDRSYELVGGADWHQLVAIDLKTGEGLWRQELGPAPVEAGEVRGDAVWVRAGGAERAFAARDGTPMPTTPGEAHP